MTRGPRARTMAGAELFSYTAEYGPAGVTSSLRSRRDIQIRLGLGFPFGGGSLGMSR